MEEEPRITLMERGGHDSKADRTMRAISGRKRANFMQRRMYRRAWPSAAAPSARALICQRRLARSSSTPVANSAVAMADDPANHSG